MNQYFSSETEWIYIFAGFSTAIVDDQKKVKPLDTIDTFRISSDPHNDWIEESAKVMSGLNKFAAVTCI